MGLLRHLVLVRSLGTFIILGSIRARDSHLLWRKLSCTLQVVMSIRRINDLLQYLYTNKPLCGKTADINLNTGFSYVEHSM